MTVAGDSILVTPGTGATVATHTVNSKEHQVVMVADEAGHIIGSRDLYFYNVVNQAHVNTGNTVHWDLWNGDAALLVRVRSIRQVPDVSTAVTGIALNWLLERTTAIGTAGSAVTAWLPDLSQTALDADITCRSKPTGGATASVDLNNFWLSAEETNSGTIMISAMNGLELVPALLSQPNSNCGILLRPSQGLRMVQVTASAAGSSSWMIGFTVE